MIGAGDTIGGTIMSFQAKGPGASPAASILADLSSYNADRVGAHKAVRWRVPVFVGIPALLAVAVFIVLISNRAGTAAGIVMVAAIFGLVFLYAWAAGPATKLQQSFRDKLIPSAFGFIEGVRYQNKGEPQSFSRMPSAAIGHFTRKGFDDQISGRYEGLDFEVYEASMSRKAGKGTVQVFKGVILAMKLDKPFHGVLVATKPVGSVTKFFRDLFGSGGLEQVVTGNTAVDEAYEVRSNNPQDALPLAARLTAALDQLHDEWPDQPGRVALCESAAFVLLPTAKNFFELPSISQDCDYHQHISPMVGDIRKMLQTARLVKTAVDG